MINIPKEAQKALEMLNSAGFEAWVVGGIVRNSLMGLDVSDADITTNALPRQTAKVFEGYHLIETGLKHGTVTVMVDMDNSTPGVSKFYKKIEIDADIPQEKKDELIKRADSCPVCNILKNEKEFYNMD